MSVTPSMTGKTVLITGGTGGIGRAAAIGLASVGAQVGITGRDRGQAERRPDTYVSEGWQRAGVTNRRVRRVDVRVLVPVPLKVAKVVSTVAQQ